MTIYKILKGFFNWLGSWIHFIVQRGHPHVQTYEIDFTPYSDENNTDRLSIFTTASGSDAQWERLGSVDEWKHNKS